MDSIFAINRDCINSISRNFISILDKKNEKIILIALGVFSVIVACLYLGLSYLKSKKIASIPPKEDQNSEELTPQTQIEQPAQIQKNLTGCIFNRKTAKAVQVIICSYLDPFSGFLLSRTNRSCAQLSREPQVVALMLNNMTNHTYVSIMSSKVNLDNRNKFLCQLKSSFIKKATNKEIAPFLTKLDLDNFSFHKNNEILVIRKVCHNIEEIEISEDFYTHEIINQFFEGLEKLKKIRVYLEPDSKVKLPSTLESLDLTINNQSDTINLINIIKELTNLKTLYLNCNYVTSELISQLPVGLESLHFHRDCTFQSNKDILMLFKRLPQLKDCSFHYTDLESDALKNFPIETETLQFTLCKKLSNSALITLFDRVRKHLKHLYLGGCTQLESATLSHIPEVESLKLFLCTQLSQEALIELLIRLKFKLKDLDLRNCPQLTLDIFKHLPGQLEFLNLSNSKFSDKSFLELSRLTNLRYLSIFGTNITDKTLYQLLKQLTNLEELDVSNCMLSPYQFLDCLRTSEHLKVLHLSHCKDISLLTFTGLPLQNLKILDLRQTSMTRGDIKEIKSRFPNLIIWT